MRLRDRIHDALHAKHQQLVRDKSDPNKKKGSLLVTVCIVYYALCLFKLLRGR